MEELQESDVLWPDTHHRHQYHHPDCHRHHSHANHHQQQQRSSTARQQRQSAPVRIPAAQPAEVLSTSRRYSWARGHDDEGDDDDDDDGAIVRRASSGAEAAAIVPPHVLAASRRCAAERSVASSVCVGHGRTLKGRDLRAVRNAVLHMTGFLSSSDEY